MTCQHCGARVPQHAEACRQCGLHQGPAKMASGKRNGKVIPFRTRKARRPHQPFAKPSRWMWWFGLLLLISLISPYLWPFH